MSRESFYQDDRDPGRKPDVYTVRTYIDGKLVERDLTVKELRLVDLTPHIARAQYLVKRYPGTRSN